MTAYELTTGVERWVAEVPASEPFDLRPAADGLVVASVASIADGDDKNLVAFDVEDGSVAWEADLGVATIDEVVRSGTTTLLVAVGDESTTVLDGATGEVLATRDEELDLRPTGGALAYVADEEVQRSDGGPVAAIDLPTLEQRFVVETEGIVSFVQPIPGGFEVPLERGEGTLLAYQG